MDDWKYHGKTHTHDGNGSSTISYNNLTDSLSADDSTIENTDGVLSVKQTTGVYAKRTTNQTLTTGIHTLLQTNTEDYDDLSEYNVGTYTTTLTNDGWYNIAGTITWVSNSTGVRILEIYIDGATSSLWQIRDVNASNMRQNLCLNLYLVAGTTIKLYAYQASGGDLVANSSSISIKGYIN